MHSFCLTILMLAVAMVALPLAVRGKPTTAQKALSVAENGQGSGKKWATVTLKLTSEEHDELLKDLQDFIESRRAETGEEPPRKVMRAYVLNWYLRRRQEQARRYWDAVQRVLRPGRGPWTM